MLHHTLSVRAIILAILLALAATPAAEADHVSSSRSERSCDVVAGVARACQVVLRQQVELVACDATGCEAHHACGLELSGTKATAQGECEGQTWALATEWGLTSASRVSEAVWIPAGTCRDFIAMGEGRAPVQELGLPVFETGLFENVLRVCVA